MRLALVTALGLLAWLSAGCGGGESHSARDPDLIERAQRQFKAEVQAEGRRQGFVVPGGGRVRCKPLSDSKLRCTAEAKSVGTVESGPFFLAFVTADGTLDRRTGELDFVDFPKLARARRSGPR